jgi:hypothetical protein
MFWFICDPSALSRITGAYRDKSERNCFFFQRLEKQNEQKDPQPRLLWHILNMALATTPITIKSIIATKTSVVSSSVPCLKNNVDIAMLCPTSVKDVQSIQKSVACQGSIPL